MGRARIFGAVAVATVALGVPGLVACSGGAKTAQALLPAASSVVPVDVNVGGAAGVRPDKKVVITTDGATLSKVRVVAQTGGRVPGHFSQGHGRWTSTDPLTPATTYSVDVIGDDGGPVTMSSSFRTLVPKQLYYAQVAPLTGETVGVG